MNVDKRKAGQSSPHRWAGCAEPWMLGWVHSHSQREGREAQGGDPEQLPKETWTVNSQLRNTVHSPKMQILTNLFKGDASNAQEILTGASTELLLWEWKAILTLLPLSTPPSSFFSTWHQKLAEDLTPKNQVPSFLHLFFYSCFMQSMYTFVLLSALYFIP